MTIHTLGVRVRFRSFCTVLVTGIFLIVTPSVTATGAPEGSPCVPGTPDNATATTSFYDPDRQFLGPEPLPSDPPIGPLLGGYQRFGSLTVDAFVAEYRSDNGWIYPPADGFEVDNGQPVKHPQELTEGARIDRFGYSGGRYLAPVGDPFAQRALPPQNLNTPSGTPLGNYHLYCVAKAFQVDAGPIAAWFGQPGGGTQYKLEPTYLPESGAALSVTWLIQNGYLVEERPA